MQEMIFTKNVGRLLECERENKGLSIAELAKITKIDSKFLKDYEQGVQSISLYHNLFSCYVLDLHAYDFCNCLDKEFDELV